MNMAKTFTSHNWEVFMCELTKELGFTSEAAQKYVKKCSDHHKTMSILKVAQIGFWYELLLPYVRNRLSSGSPMSVNDEVHLQHNLDVPDGHSTASHWCEEKQC